MYDLDTICKIFTFKDISGGTPAEIAFLDVMLGYVCFLNECNVNANGSRVR